MTTETDLLPMPKGEAVGMYQAWSYDQMQIYARANIARAVAPLQVEIEALRGALEEAEEAMRFVHASCATFPQEPQHVQNAAWRRIVNAIAKARAALEKENRND